MNVYSCNQMKKIEENAFERGMSYLEMMENAGYECYKYIIRSILKDKNNTVCVLCGKGKNGGDGYVIARYLEKNGVNVAVILAEGYPKATEAVHMLKTLPDYLIYDIHKSPEIAIDNIKKCDVIVDCIFGIGFKGETTGLTSELISNINMMKKTVVSIDIPSGLEGDSGKASGNAFEATYTLAVSCLKPVHVMKPSKDYCGNTVVIDIGFYKECYTNNVTDSFKTADNKYIKDKLIKRTSESNKGTYGKLLCVCGSRNMQGAAVLCTNAAIKSGAGLVFSAFPDKAYNAIAPKVTEALMIPLKDDKRGFLSFDAESTVMKYLKKSSAVVAGCGLGNTEATQRIINCIIKNAKCPVIIDADGINAVSHNINILKSAGTDIILTPHPGEMSRLTGNTVEEIQSDRINIARNFAQKNGVTLILKGNNSVIAFSDGTVFVNPTGNAGMAKGGSGDVLAGIVGSFLAQGMNARDAAVCAAYIHGMCGDEVAKEYSMTGMTPSMMIDYLPKLFSKFE